MNIIKTNLKFRGSMSNRSKTNRIILHHAEAASCTPEQIHNWHLNNGWSGAGYHFLVRKNGKVYALRPENKIGSHAKGANSDSIGICFEGNFMTETMSQAQINAGNELVNYLKKKYGIAKVLRHKEVCSTSCPGTNFPFSAITASQKAGWKKDSKGWWYRNANGSYPKAKWLHLDAWYYFNDKGYAVTGWHKINGYWYYLDSDCRMQTGWIKLKGKWYYLHPSKDGSWPEGSAHIGWIKLKGVWYYLKKKSEGTECSMACNETMTIAGKNYTFDKNGAMQ